MYTIAVTKFGVESRTSNGRPTGSWNRRKGVRTKPTKDNH